MAVIDTVEVCHGIENSLEDEERRSLRWWNKVWTPFVDCVTLVTVPVPSVDIAATIVQLLELCTPLGRP